MSLFLSSLNSGSNGNCYYVGNESEAVLIDAGISCRETEKRMLRSGLNIRKVKAIFISHEHSDHIKGVEVLSKKYSLPVYITQSTHLESRLNIQPQLLRTFKHATPAVIGSLVIYPFKKRHDAIDPHSFVIESEGVKVSVLTDIGSVCENVSAYFKDCHASILEANYDEEMLENGSYPYFLKSRITSDHGHLSNKQALDFFLTHRSEQLSHLILGHLSKDNNCPQLVHKLFSTHAEGTQITVASRYNETEVFHITGSNVPSRQASQIALF